MKKKLLWTIIILQALLLLQYFWDPNRMETRRLEEIAGRYHVADRLTSRNVTAFAEDGKHRIWIGTDDGLNIFDGHSFIQLVHEVGDTTTLPDDNIQTIYRDSRGRMWVGTSAGVAEYLGGYKFRQHPVPVTRSGIPQITESADGTLLANNGTDVFSVSGDSVTRYFHFPTNDATNRLLCDRTGGFWTVAGQDLTHYNRQRRPDYKACAPHANLCYYFQHGDTLLVSQSRQVTLIDTRDNRILYKSKEDMTILPNAMYIGHDGSILLCSGYHGLYSLDTRSGALTKVTEDRMHLHHKDVTISAFFRDSEDNMWVGYQNGGFQIFPHTAAKGGTATLLTDNTEEQTISCIDAVSDGIIGSTEDQVFYYQTGTGRFTAYPFYDIFPDSPFFRQTLCNAVPYGDDTAWLVSNVRILSCTLHDGKIHTLSRVFSRDNLGPKLGMGVRSGDDIFVASDSPYLLRCRFGSTHADSIAVGIPGYNSMSKLCTLPDGSVLIVMKDMQFATVDPRNSSIRQLKAQCQERPSDFVPSAAVVSGDTVWIATKRSGLYRLTLHDNTLAKDSIVPISDIQNMCLGKDHSLWICSHDNVMAYTPAQTRFYFYPLSSASNWQEEQHPHFKDICPLPQTDAIIVGTATGCMTLPRIRGKGTYKPRLTITTLTLNKTERTARTVNDSFPEGAHYTFRHSDNDVTITFGGSEYGSHEHFMYQYMLEGHDRDWQTALLSQQAHFADLAPGKYVFRVRLVASPGQPPLAMRSICITVKPALWQSSAAIFFYIMTVLALIIYINRLYLRMRTERMELAQVSRDHKRDQITNEMNMRFFANISHEFRNPLTIITGPLMVLRDDKSIPSSAHHQINMVCKSVNRMLRLIDQMLDFNQLETDVLRLKVCECDIANEVRQTIRIFEESARIRGIQVQCSGLDDNVYGWMDRDKMEKVMNNLLTNALKHVDGNGTISVHMETSHAADAPDPAIHLSATSERMVSVKVFNSGSHIKEDKLQDVFKRYYQIQDTTEKHQYGWGTGIGLYYVKRLLTLHHGDVWVYNGDGGVTFQFVLPIDATAYDESERVEKGTSVMQIPIEQEEKDVESKVLENRQTVNTIAKRPVVLVVDDDTEVAQYIRNLLTDDYVVVNRYSAEAALDDMERTHPDIVLSDVVMGDMNGYDLCRALKQNMLYSHVPVILITAKSEVAEQVEGLDSGANAYVSKPFDPRYLKALVRNLLEQKEKIRRLLSEGEPERTSDGQLSEQDRHFMDEMYDFLEKHLSDQDLNVSTVSHALLISNSKFNYKLKELTGETPGSFFRKYKLNRAAKLLREGRHNVSEVSAMTGFGTVSYFSVAFKKQFGVSPSEYK